jgi:hypothetical protein
LVGNRAMRIEGATVWEGVVHVFDLEGHPKATRAYAWSSPIEGSTKRRFFAVLGIPVNRRPIGTPDRHPIGTPSSYVSGD